MRSVVWNDSQVPWLFRNTRPLPAHDCDRREVHGRIGEWACKWIFPQLRYQLLLPVDVRVVYVVWGAMLATGFLLDLWWDARKRYRQQQYRMRFPQL